MWAWIQLPIPFSNCASVYEEYCAVICFSWSTLLWFDTQSTAGLEKLNWKGSSLLSFYFWKGGRIDFFFFFYRCLVELETEAIKSSAEWLIDEKFLITNSISFQSAQTFSFFIILFWKITCR